MRACPWRPWALALAFGAAACSTAPPTRPSHAGPLAAEGVPDSLRWSRSAEYAALCLQLFNLALERLRATPDPGGELPAAVVMDLDETVLDNFGFQLELVRAKTTYDAALWDAWVERDEAGLVPGAARFIEGARALGLEVVFLSNRSEASRQATLATLRRLGVVSGDAEPPLYLKQEGGSKEPRREAVQTRYRVVAYFGDNLADFDAGFEPEARGDGFVAWQRVCALRERWGTLWFVLPNAMYGGWKRGDETVSIAKPPPPCP